MKENFKPIKMDGAINITLDKGLLTERMWIDDKRSLIGALIKVCEGKMWLGSDNKKQK